MTTITGLTVVDVATHFVMPGIGVALTVLVTIKTGELGKSARVIVAGLATLPDALVPPGIDGEKLTIVFFKFGSAPAIYTMTITAVGRKSGAGMLSVVI